MSTKVNLKTAIRTAEDFSDLQTEMSTMVNLKTTFITAEESLDFQTEMFLMELLLMTRSMAASYALTQMVKLREKSG